MKESLLNQNIVNPEKSSIREEMLDLVPTEDPKKFIDKNTKETFYYIGHNKYPYAQKFTSLISKGIINTVDIVTYDEKIFSHEQKLDNINTSEKDVQGEILADTFLLKNIFGDHDKIYSEEYLNKDGKVLIENAKIDYKSNKKNYFDFEFGTGLSLLNSKIAIDEFSEKVNKELTKILKTNVGIDAVKNLHQKSELFLKTLFSDENYSRFENIIQRSGIRTDGSVYQENDKWIYSDRKYATNYSSNNKEERDRELFNDLRKRFEIIHDLTKK